MDVSLYSLDARHGAGAVIVIDVFRAFTTTAVALDEGAAEVLFVADPQTALALRASGRVDLCLGERGGRRVEGFDFSNSPGQLREASISGARLALTTSNGTRGLLDAVAAGAERVFAAALVNAGATARAVAARAPQEVAVVAMGRASGARADEDELCALLLRARLQGREPHTRALAVLLASMAPPPAAALLRDGHYHADDRAIATAVDSVPVAMEADCSGPHPSVCVRAAA